MDEACCFRTFQRFMTDHEKRVQVKAPSSEGYVIYQGMMAGLLCFAESIRGFREQITKITKQYSDPLKQRINYSISVLNRACVPALLVLDFS